MLTETQRRALIILRDNGPMRASDFGLKLWPDNPAWKHHTKCGHGTTRGGGMKLASGAYLGKLAKLGLARLTWSRFSEGWEITDRGSRALKGGVE